MRARTVVVTAFTVEYHIAEPTSWDAMSSRKFSSRLPPGSIREERTSWLVFVADTTMK